LLRDFAKNSCHLALEELEAKAQSVHAPFTAGWSSPPLRRAPSLFAEIRRQLELKLVAAKAPGKVIAIDPECSIRRRRGKVEADSSAAQAKDEQRQRRNAGISPLRYAPVETTKVVGCAEERGAAL
jgi:hypothetical protein